MRAPPIQWWERGLIGLISIGGALLVAAVLTWIAVAGQAACLYIAETDELRCNAHSYAFIFLVTTVTGVILLFWTITAFLYRMEHGFAGYPIARDLIILSILPLLLLAFHLAQIEPLQGEHFVLAFAVATALCLVSWWWHWWVFATVTAAYAASAIGVIVVSGIGWPLLLVYTALSGTATGLTLASRLRGRSRRSPPIADAPPSGTLERP